jgi:hypothetical protein
VYPEVDFLKDAEVLDHYQKYLEKCRTSLKTIDCWQGWEIKIRGLSGWIFENLVADLIKQAIPSVSITPQPRLYPKGSNKRAKADLLVNNKIAVEAKVAGVYSDEYIEKLGEYRKAAAQKGWAYLYISGGESYEPYYERTIHAMGRQNAFFLDDRGKDDWNRFTDKILQLLRENST